MNEEDAQAIEKLLAQTEPASDDDIRLMRKMFNMFCGEILKDPRTANWLRRNSMRLRQLQIEGWNK